MSEIKNLVDLYRTIMNAQISHCPMPDEICNSLSRTLIQIEDEVILSHANSFDDLKAMFELVPMAMNLGEYFTDSKASEICQLAQLAAIEMDGNPAA
jgi:hypothetical protein